MIAGWTLADPLWLLALLALPAIAWLRARRGQPVFVIPFVSRWTGRDTTPRSRLPQVLVVAGLVLLAVALARPQHIDEKRQVRQKGYDIVLAIDLSGSMLAEDYERGGERINRLQAVKPIIEAFMKRRPSDRIGIVTFAGRAYTLAPLTPDHDWLERQVRRLKVGLIEDGTAIGDGLSLAIARLGQPNRETAGQRLGGFVILLTDGANNAGAVEPLQAAAVAEAKGIPVYTIAAGQEGVVPMPVFDADGRKLGYRNSMSEIDEPTLRAIADQTGGQYFRAMDSGTVDAAFAAIDRARTIEFDAKSSLNVQEFYSWLAWPALALLLAGFTAASGSISLRGAAASRIAALTSRVPSPLAGEGQDGGLLEPQRLPSAEPPILSFPRKGGRDLGIGAGASVQPRTGRSASAKLDQP
ncbi:MAG: VWA domain-containing protein [Candidatus Binatia bacterium]